MSDQLFDMASDEDFEIEYLEYEDDQPMVEVQYTERILPDPLSTNGQNTMIVYDAADVKDEESLGSTNYEDEVEDLKEELTLDSFKEEMPLTPPKRRLCDDAPKSATQPSNIAGPSGVRVDVKKESKKKTKVPNAGSSSPNVSVKIAKKMKSKDVLNCGSEDEDDSEGDDDATLMPRTLSMFLESDEDMQQDDDEAGQLHVTKPDSVTDDGIQFGPTTLFDFKWRPFPSEPVPARQRREVFVGHSGPTIQPTMTPYEIFTSIWDHSIMEHIAEQTNLYAQHYTAELLDSAAMAPHSRISKWVDTNVKELYVYFGLMLAMGVVVKPKIEEYWSTKDDIFLTHKFATYMIRTRFELLGKCLHFKDNSRLSPELSPSEAKMYKIAPIIEHLNSRFASLYDLGQNVALDESQTLWKGRLNINQFIRNKKAGIGIKTYEVCDSRTGYLWRFEVHRGALTHNGEIISGGIPNLVLRLLRGLEHSGRTIWMDSYYNSPSLARVLKTLGLDCVGTLRTSRLMVPNQIAALRKQDMRPGQVCGCTSGDVDLVVWRDQNRVAMISTYHGVTVSGGKPNVVKDYNVCMGGVDRKDQMLSAYPIERKRTHIWYKKFFRRLLNVSVLNAYIIYKHFHPKIDHFSFRRSLISSLLDTNQTPPQRPHQQTISGRKLSHEALGHFPTELGHLPKGGRLRRTCGFCKARRSSFYCHSCKVGLCFGDGRNCYLKYHS